LRRPPRGIDLVCWSLSPFGDILPPLFIPEATLSPGPASSETPTPFFPIPKRSAPYRRTSMLARNFCTVHPVTPTPVWAGTTAPFLLLPIFPHAKILHSPDQADPLSVEKMWPKLSTQQATSPLHDAAGFDQISPLARRLVTLSLRMLKRSPAGPTRHPHQVRETIFSPGRGTPPIRRQGFHTGSLCPEPSTKLSVNERCRFIPKPQQTLHK